MGGKLDSKTTAEEATNGVDLTGRVAIVTGAASGLGEETARVLTLRGAEVVIAARKVEAGEAAKKRILAQQSNAIVSVQQLDLSSLPSVRKFAEEFLATQKPLHILVNNAGCMAMPYNLNKDGREMHFVTNHLGHFLLTNLLLEKIKDTATKSGTEGRIVILSSSYHAKTYAEGIRFDKLDSAEGYKPWLAYGQSKLANVLHAAELTRRLQADGVKNVTVNSLHPGVIRTNLMRHAAAPGVKAAFFSVAYNGVLRYLWKTIPQGAATSCFLATSPTLNGVSGRYFEDLHEATPSKYAQDPAMAARLWTISEQLVA